MLTLEEELEIAQRRFPMASLRPGKCGSHLLVFPLDLPEDYLPRQVLIITRLPPGYPCCQPSDFFTYGKVRIADSQNFEYPHETQVVPIGMRFNWKLQAWNPNRDNILTWIYTIRSRFQIRNPNNPESDECPSE